MFVQAVSPHNIAVKHAAVILPFQEQAGFICQEHKVLGVCPVTQIVGWYPPLNDQCILIPFQEQAGFICQEHEVLGVSPVTPIVGWYLPLNEQCILIPIDSIKDLCICMEIETLD